MDKVTTVYFADVLPGTGKTRWAINQMLACLKNRDSIILYVAPTIELLDEVAAKLLASGYPKVRQHVLMLASDGAHRVGAFSDHLSIPEQVKLVLDGGVIPGTDQVFKKCGPGTVVLVTHETFLRLPHNLDDQGGVLTTIKRRSQVKVIFDEARKCLLQEAQFVLPADALDVLFSQYLVAEHRQGLGNDFRTLRIKAGRALTLKTFNQLFVSHNEKVRDSASALWQILQILTATPSNELYVKGDYVGDDARSDRRFSLHVLLVPQKLFHGWRQVILLSAFFRCSQMYHLLREQDINRLPALERQVQKTHAIELVDVSSKLISKRRYAEVISRYAQTSITYLSPNSKFSKNQLLHGVLVESAFSDPTFVKDYREWLSANAKSIPLRKACELHLLGRTSGVLKSLISRLPLYRGNKWRPLQFYAKAAEALSRAWYDRIGQDPQPLPMMTNVGGKKSRAGHEPKFWQHDVMTAVPKDSVVKLPYGIHGLNKFSSYHTLAYLAAINPTSETKSLFSYLCPDYIADLDHTVDHAVQAAMRISMRNTKDSVPPLIIVTDQSLALKMHAHLQGKPNIVSPLSLCPNLPILDIVAVPLQVHRGRQRERMKQDKVYAAKVKAGVASQVKRSRDRTKQRENYVRIYSQHHSKVASLRACISRLKRQGRDVSKQQATLASILPVYHQEVAELRRTYDQTLINGNKGRL